MSDFDLFEVNPAFYKPGLTSAGNISIDCPPVKPLDISKVKKLGELLPDYAFYTPAIVHLTVPFTVDPFADFVQEYGTAVQRYSFKSHKQLFKHLIHPNGSDDWNYALFAMPLEHWAAYKTWAGSCAYGDFRKSLLRRVRIQELKVSDPLITTTNIAPELLPVTAFVIESNKGSFYFTESTGGMPSAYYDQAMVYADTADFAQKLLNGDTDPYNVERP